MNSDDYFDDELDSAFLNEVAAIEAAYVSPERSCSPVPKQPIVLLDDSEDFDLSMDLNDDDLKRLDTFIEDSYQGRAAPIPGSSLKQTTLWGQEPPETSTKAKPAVKPPSRASFGSKAPFGKQAKKTKQWDRTAFAKSGWKKPPTSKGKGKVDPNAEEYEGDEEQIEFEQFPAPFVSIGPPPPMKLTADRSSIQYWLYPLNQDKRDYQFNIVKQCLFDNTLVALPTGLGKTFIAGVVMLNFYRWFPTGKVVFVAPTKPLVAQQIEACHRTCGIPGSDAAELTGEVSRSARNRAWQEKRVFYMTPQTLINDLIRENCDPSNIILLVVDEAHKGKGDYAYAQVVRFMMAKNPHFRLLALTATPGSNTEAVQEIVDSLHITHIEIRDEESLDLRPYMFKKKLELHVVKMDEDICKVRDLLAKIMEPLAKKLQGSGLLRGFVDVTILHPYRCQALLQEIRFRNNASWAYSPLGLLAPLARSMGYLIEASVGMCYDSLKSLVEGDDPTCVTDKPSSTKKAKKNVKLGNDPNYQAVMKELERQKRRPNGFAPHPKMENLKMLVIQHFANRIVDPDQGGGGGLPESNADDTRVMVFVTFRNCVEEIVEFLNRERPLLRVTKFIGQSTDKDGNKGFAQREQLDIIRRFKSGEFNVLVSTSIGEEGLDIGEIDLIVCYDAQKTPIRMLQRVGRTGRKREGHVHVLLSEGREENNWSKAQDSYQEVQHSIVRGDQLELYGDVERLIPDDVKPQCKELVMEIEEYVRGKGKRKPAGSPLKETGKKRKRDDNVGRNIPSGASAGFVTVKDLIIKGTGKKRKKNTAVFPDEHGLESDDTDREIEAGWNGPRRTVSEDTNASGKRKSKKTSLKRSATAVDKRKPKEAPKVSLPTRLQDLTSSQFDRLGVDDSDDMEIERGLHLASPRQSPSRRIRSSSSPPSDAPRDQSVIEIFSSPELHAASPERPISRPISSGSHNNSIVKKASQAVSAAGLEAPNASPLRPRQKITSPIRNNTDNVAWLLDDDDEPNMVIEIISSSPHPGYRQAQTPQVIKGLEDSEVEFADEDLSALEKSPHKPRDRFTDEVKNVDHYNSSPQASSSRPKVSRPAHSPSRLSTPPPRASKSSRSLMPPPSIPFRPAPATSIPEPSFPIRPLGKQAKKRSAVLDALDSPPPPSQRRLQRSSSPDFPPAPPRKKVKHFDINTRQQQLDGWVEAEAVHSGDEVSAGSSHEDDSESESDRQFLKDVPDTQVSPSYDQTMAYRHGLLSQAPTGAPLFSRAPVRSRPFGVQRSPRQRTSVSSSPPPEEGPDEYIMGSFVVDDDAELSYLNSSEP